MIDLLALAAASAASCPAERAHYALRGQPQITAYFRAVDSGDEWPSHLALAITSKVTGEVTWWLPWQGGTNGRTNIASTTDATKAGWRPPNPDGGPRPLGDRQFLTTDESYNFLGSIPRQGKTAPAHMLNPDAGSSQDRIFPIKQFFDFMSCAKDGS